jgi:plastocyanin
MKRLTLLLGLVVLAAAVAACSPAAGGQPASAGPVDPNAPVISAQGNAFTPATFTVKAGKAVTLTFNNKDGAPHNVAIYKDASASEKISIGEIVSSSTASQLVPALEKGQYFFRCDVHHEMTGTLVVE